MYTSMWYICVSMRVLAFSSAEVFLPFFTISRNCRPYSRNFDEMSARAFVVLSLE